MQALPSPKRTNCEISLWLLALAPAAAAAFGFRAKRRIPRPGECPACRYPLRGAPTCPECGRPASTN